MRSVCGWKITIANILIERRNRESEDSIDTSYGGDPLVIGFSSRYLLEFLKVARWRKCQVPL